MSKAPMIADRDWVIKRLSEVERRGKINASYHLGRKLEEKGYVKPTFEKVGDGRGRTSKFYKLSGVGARMLARAKAKKAAEKEAKQKAH